MMVTQEINNYPAYADEYRFIVYSINSDDGSKWFYGAYSDGVMCGLIAYKIRGGVYDRETGRHYDERSIR